MSKTTDTADNAGPPVEHPSVLATLRSLYTAFRHPAPTTRPRPPATRTDDVGRDIRYRVFEPNATEALVELYEAFEYEDRAQGLPPAGTAGIRDWLESIWDDVAVVALHQDAIVGHAMFVPDGDGNHELSSFVHPEYQDDGVGAALLETGLGYANTVGVDHVWLTVEARNDALLTRYRDAGFTVDDPRGPLHRLTIEL